MARTPKFKPKEHLDEVRKLASLGLSEAQIAMRLNVHLDIFRYHRQKCKELDRAIQEGLNSTVIRAAEELQRLIMSCDFKAIKFFLEKKGGWGNDTQVNTVKKPSHQSFNLTLVEPKRD